jgi:hypothetical protein
MSPRPERSPRRLAARALLGALLALAAVPVYLAVSPSWRFPVVRLVCAAIVAFGCARIIRAVRERIEVNPRSPLDAPPARPPSPALDARFLRLRDDLTFSARRRRYFDTILWPRLQALAGGDLPLPVERRRLGGRGPSRAAIARLIAEIERRG